MARKRIALLLALAFAASLAGMSSAPASSTRAPKTTGGAGAWTRLSDLNQKSIDDVALVRTADQVLHAFYLRYDGNDLDLVQRAIAPTGGTQGSAVTIEDNWNGMADPDAVLTPDGGLRVFFGGIRSGAEDPQQWANTSVSDQSGLAWTLQPGSVAQNDAAYAGQMGAGTDMTGNPFISWDGVYVHRGLDPTDPNYNFMETITGLCCGYLPDIATDSVTGEMFVGWASNADDAPGMWAHEMDPATGAPLGSPMLMPRSLTDNFGEDSFIFDNARTPITGRVGAPGVYMAYHGGYPFPNKILLWRVGDPDSEVLKKSDGNISFNDVGVAAAPDGRLWVYWLRESDDVWRVYVRRSNLDATKFGTTVYTKAPKNSDPAWKIVGNAQADRIDVVVTAKTDNGTAHFTTQLFPGLTLKADPVTFTGQKEVTFTALDAGDPVEGAVVHVAGKECTTDAAGECQITLGPYNNKKKFTATVTKEGYIGSDVVITVKP